jgi:hypothetical protein
MLDNAQRAYFENRIVPMYNEVYTEQAQLLGDMFYGQIERDLRRSTNVYDQMYLEYVRNLSHGESLRVFGHAPSRGALK